jgi:hypothetical protein
MFRSCKTLVDVLTLLIVSCTSLNAQQPTQRQTGIYKTYQEFLDNKPSITKAFALMVDTCIDFERHDTTFSSFYRYIENKKRIKNVWGLCDSGVVYADTEQGLVPISYTGRYPFIVFEEKNTMTVGIPLASAAVPTAIGFTVLMGLDNLLSPSRKRLLYFNAKGEAIIASDQSIGWLLRKDKDLAEAFNHEVKTNIQVYRKYLLAMNERYPLNL